jgi:hypothetical protein
MISALPIKIKQKAREAISDMKTKKAMRYVKLKNASLRL